MADAPRKRIAFDLPDSDYLAIERAAADAGVPPNTLARALFRWALPVFRSGDFQLPALKRRFGDGDELLAALDPNRNRRQKPAKPKAS